MKSKWIFNGKNEKANDYILFWNKNYEKIICILEKSNFIWWKYWTGKRKIEKASFFDDENLK